MKAKLLSASAVFALASGAALLVNLLLARGLAPGDYATYALLFAFFSFLAMLADAGVAQKYLRYFLADDGERYDWRRTLRNDIWLPVGIAALCALAFHLSYPGISRRALAMTAAAALAATLTGWLTSLLRARTTAAWVALVQRGLPFAMLLGLPVFLALPGPVAPRTGGYLAALSGLVAGAALALAWRLLPRGTAALPVESQADGRSFTALWLGTAVFFYADKFLVAKLCPAEAFASYSLLAVCFQVFDLLNASFAFVLAPLFARGVQDSTRLLAPAALGLGTLAGGLGLAIAFLLPRLVPHFPALPPGLILAFAAAGVAKVLQGLLMSHLNLRAESALLRRYVWQNSLLLALGIAGMAWATWRHGAVGAAWALAAVWAARLALAWASHLAASLPARALGEA